LELPLHLGADCLFWPLQLGLEVRLLMIV